MRRTAPSGARKKSPVRLTRLEVCRGGRLVLGITVSDGVLAKIGADLGTILTKIAPGARTIADDPGPADLVISPLHEDGDETYHAALREHLTHLFGALCDTALTDALQIARAEQARRAEGRN